MEKNELQKLIGYNIIDFNNLVLSYYQNIGLDEINAVMLIKLNEFKKMGKNVLQVKQLTKKMCINELEVMERVEELIKKGYISIELEYTKDKKQSECFDLSPTIEKIIKKNFENNQKQKGNKEVKIEQLVVDMIEQEFQKPLSPMDIQIIGKWIQEDAYDFEEIKEALLNSVRQNKKSLKYMDVILLRHRQDRMSEKQTYNPDILKGFDAPWKK